MNNLSEENDVMVRIGSNWYKLDEIGTVRHDSFPIMVSDEDGGEHEFDMADVDEFDPLFEAFRELDWQNVGVA